ncbi:EamA family transporter RarD [Corynebacterium crudilactis]|uniref:Protein rarD n=1 Tax=Corynebacterium crudilactis TaxID=1652495 RepID=A0A172QUI7_9CORY|nr:EamA family transporter RarD [Corynebacterium crudilactis]ANE04379.1 protein rarD [Corynebacterium crudilactis]
MIYGVLAYLGWGMFPAFFPLLLPAGPFEILAHRILWTSVLMMLVITFTKGWRELKQADRGTWIRIVLASVFIAANWLIYVIAVNSGHVTEAALGYFINPLVSVVFGIILFKEQLRRLQMSAVFIALVGVLVLTFLSGQPPYLALSLAFTFGVYGALKKQVNMSAMGSLTAETLVLLPIAAGYLVWLEMSGDGTFFNNGADHSALLISSGLVTALPLLMFGLAAKAIPLSTVGMLQYMTPTMQMLWALFVVNEVVEPARWVGFIIIWIAVAIYLTDIIRKNHADNRH